MKSVFERGGERWVLERRDSTVISRRYQGETLVLEETTDHAHELRAKYDEDRFGSSLREQGFVSVGRSGGTIGDGELEDALRRAPDDVALYSVYGDWLVDRGDVWGELINLQCAVAQLPRFGAGAEREKFSRHQTLLLFKRSSHFWGELGSIVVDEATQRYAADCVAADWFCGFLRGVGVHNLPPASCLEVSRFFATLAALPIARLLRSMSVSGLDMNPGALEAVAAHEWPLLKTIDVSNYAPLNGRGDPFASAALGGLLDGVRGPKLVEVAVSGANDGDSLCVMLSECVQASMLRTLRIEDTAIGSRGIAALALGAFDSLENLVVAGNLPEGARTQLAEVAPNVRVDRRVDPEG